MDSDSYESITFIHAPLTIYEQTFGASFIPLWAYTLASNVQSNKKLSLFDLRFTKIKEVTHSDLFVFSGINQDLPEILKAQKYLKNKFPDSAYIIGGPITWSFDKSHKLDRLLAFDHIFIGDGEDIFPKFCERKKDQHFDKIVRVQSRFKFNSSRKNKIEIFGKQKNPYYGAVVEVSRGCPFLCEFCDIRVLPQNNQSNNKNVEIIVAEVDQAYKTGSYEIQLACDNFIGDVSWASKCVDELLKWKRQNNANVAFHTWVTVNLSLYPEMMQKMREAGFVSVFIGVESFNSLSILETGKIQNKSDYKLIHALKEIHSFGFIVAPGLIFGFDNDDPEMFERTIKGIEESGLIGGDPTFLLALPGTPLYTRMKKSGRLIENEKNDLPLERMRVSKIESNIRFIQPKEFLVKGFIKFIQTFNSPDFNKNRFLKHLELIASLPNVDRKYIRGYGNVLGFVFAQFRSLHSVSRFILRIYVLLKPKTLVTILTVGFKTFKKSLKVPGAMNHFYFWIFAWSNSLLKYRKISENDFQLFSVQNRDTKTKDANFEKSLTDFLYVPEIESDIDSSGRNSDGTKVLRQLKATQEGISLLKENVYKNGAQAWLNEFEEKISTKSSPS